MAPKREQTLWPTVWPIAERLEKSFGLTPVLSAGVVLFDGLDGNKQRELIAQVHDGKLELAEISAEEIHRRLLLAIKDFEAYRAKKKLGRKAKTGESRQSS